MMRSWGSAAIAALLSSVAYAAPIEVSHQGRISDAVGPLDGEHDVTFSLYDTATGGTPLWGEVHTLTFRDGYYSARIGSVAPLDDTLFTSDALFLGIAIDDGADLEARQRVGMVPLAVRAMTAAGFEGGVLDASELRIDGVTVIDEDGRIVGGQTLGSLTCTPDQVPIWSGTAWGCGAFPEGAVLSDAEVRAAVEASPVSLAAGSRVGGLAIQTGDHDWQSLEDIPADLDDGDDDVLGTLACVNGDVPIFQASGSRWGCLKSVDAGMSETQVIAVVEATPLELDAGTRIGGKTVLQIVQGGAVHLAEGSTLNGKAIQTGAHEWSTLTGVPATLLDGDSDAIGKLTCATGQIAVYSTAFATWGCLDLASRITEVVEAASLDLGPETTFGMLSIEEVVESAALDLHPDTTIGGSEIARREADGGDVYTRWGRTGCGDDVVLYTGFTFSKHYTHAGVADVFCIEGGDPGPGTLDQAILYMTEIGNTNGSPTIANRALPCAVCLSPASPCFTRWGRQTCPSGFTARSSGYGFGANYGHSGNGPTLCVDSGQDNSGIPGTGAWIYPLTTHSFNAAFSSQYQTSSIVKCATCCRQ